MLIRDPTGASVASINIRIPSHSQWLQRRPSRNLIEKRKRERKKVLNCEIRRCNLRMFTDESLTLELAPEEKIPARTRMRPGAMIKYKEHNGRMLGRWHSLLRHRRTKNRQTDGQTTDRQTDRQTDEQTDRQTDRQRDRHVKNVEISVIRCLFKTNFPSFPKFLRLLSRAPYLSSQSQTLFVPCTFLLSFVLTHPFLRLHRLISITCVVHSVSRLARTIIILANNIQWQ